MSYDVELVDDDGTPVAVDSHQEGGVVAVGGSTRAEMTITYNYSEYYYDHIDADEGLRWLDGKRAGDVIDVLYDAVEKLGTEQHKDYWEATEGNAGHALSVLLEWAREHPDATFRIV